MWTLVALAVSGGLAGAPGADGAQAATSTGFAPALVRADVSATRCLLELPVRIGRRRFESTQGGTVSCSGVLLGRPVVGGLRALVTGVVVPSHHDRIPSVLGAMQLRLLAVGPTLPLEPPEYTKVEASLAPDPGGTPAGGYYRGLASARRQALEAVGTLALVPQAPKDPRSRCCATGTVIIDVLLSQRRQFASASRARANMSPRWPRAS